MLASSALLIIYNKYAKYNPKNSTTIIIFYYYSSLVNYRSVVTIRHSSYIYIPFGVVAVARRMRRKIAIMMTTTKISAKRHP